MCILPGSLKKMWPMYVDYSDEECRRVLRSLELEAYSNVVSALRAQGSLTKERRKILQDLCSMFNISMERHRAEIRRAVNDEHLNTIAERLFGPNTATEWAIEGRRVVPLMTRLAPQTIFTAVADSVANAQAAKNATLPLPSKTGVREISNGIDTMASRKRKDFPCDQSSLPHKMTAVDSQYFNNFCSFDNSSYIPETSPSPPVPTSCENFSTPDSTSQISSSLPEQSIAKTTASVLTTSSTSTTTTAAATTTTTTTSITTSSQVKPPPKQIMLKSSSSTTTTSSSFDHLNSNSLITKPPSHPPVTTASHDEQQTSTITDSPKITESKSSQRSSPSITMKTPSILPTSVSSSSSSGTSSDRIPISSTSTSSMGNKFLTQIRCKNTGHGRQNLGLGLKLNSQSQISQKGLSSKSCPNIKIKQENTSSFFTKKLSQTVFSSPSTDSSSQLSLSSSTESTSVTKSPATAPKLSGKTESSVVSSSQSNNKLTTVSKSFPKTSAPSSLTRSLFSTATKVGTKPLNPVIFNVSSTSSTPLQTSTKTTVPVSNDGAKTSQLLPKSTSVGITSSNIKLNASNSQTIQYRNDGGVMRSARIVNLSQPVGSRLPCAITPSAISALGLASNLTSSGLRVTLPAGTLNTSASMRVPAAAKPNVIVVHKAQMWPRTQQGAAVIVSSAAPLPKISSDSVDSSAPKQEKSRLSGTKPPSRPIVPTSTSSSASSSSTLKIPDSSLMANPFASKSSHSESSSASDSPSSKAQENSENQCKKNLLADVIEASGILENCPDKSSANGKSSNKQSQETKEEVILTTFSESGAKMFRRNNSSSSVFDLSSLPSDITVSRSETGKTLSDTESVPSKTVEKNEAVSKSSEHAGAKEVSESLVSSSQISESLSSSAESSSSVQTETTEEKN